MPRVARTVFAGVPHHFTRNINKGLPCGSAKLVRRLEKLAGRMLTYRPRGRPRSQE